MSFASGQRRGEAYDQMLGAGNADGNAAVQTAIDTLLDQTKAIENVVARLDLKIGGFEGSDSLDDPKARCSSRRAPTSTRPKK